MVSLNKSLIGGSIILLITFNIFNFLNFGFQFAMARMLSVAEYGALAVLFSVIYIFSIFGESIQTIITRYASSENNLGKLKNLLNRSLKKAFIVSVIFFILYLIISILLSYLTGVSYYLFALTGLVIFAVFLLPINRGVMQGKKNFKSLGLNLIIESLSKLVIAIILVYALTQIMPEYRLYGAVISLALGTFLAILASFYTLRSIFNKKEEQMEIGSVYSYSFPVFFATLAVIAFYSIDVILAKIFFSPEIAGYYAIAAVLSKAIFWGTQPISKAMFPISSEDSVNKKSSNVLANSIAFLLSLIAISLIFAYFFSELIIRIFAGKYLPESAGIFFYTVLAMCILSLANLLLLYKLSKGKTSGLYYLFIAIFLEVVLLSVYSSSLLSFSIALVFSSLIFLLISSIVSRMK